MKIPAQWALITVLLLVLTGCDRDAPDQEPIVIAVDDAVAVYINGDAITLGEIQLSAIAEGVLEPGEIMTPAHPDYDRLLSQLSDQLLLAQEAERLGLDELPAARDRLEYARISILRDVFTESLVSEPAVERMYAEQVELQQLDDEVKISQILTETEADARAAFDALAAGGDFAELAFDYSIDSRSRVNGGSLGYVKPNDMPDPFPAIIGNTDVGDVADVFETDNGWHVLRIDDRRQEAPMTLEQMRPAIVQFLVEQQLQDTILQLRDRAEIARPSSGAEAEPQATDDQPENRN